MIQNNSSRKWCFAVMLKKLECCPRCDFIACPRFIILHYNSPESLSSVKQMCRHYIIYRHCIIPEDTISNTNINLGCCFWSQYALRTKFDCFWVKSTEIIVTNQNWQILSVSLPICHLRTSLLLNAQVTKPKHRVRLAGLLSQECCNEER